MDNFYRWIAKHKMTAFILFSIVMCAVYTVFFTLMSSIPTWVIIAFNVFLSLMNYAFVMTSYGKLIQKASDELENNCNPTLLYNETAFLLTCKNTETNTQLLLINHSAALMAIGKYSKAYEILSSINIDKCAGMLPANKIVYYINLMSVYINSGETDKAGMMYSKAAQMYSDLKNTKHKQLLEQSMILSHALDLFNKQEYTQVLQVLTDFYPRNLRMEVEKALVFAEVYIALNDTAKAKEKLIYVIEHANKLHAAEEARNLLEKC